MTTIAYKDGVVAADGRMCRGNEIITENFIKLEQSNGAIVAVVGNTAEGKTYATYLKDINYFESTFERVTFLRDRPWKDFFSEEDSAEVILFSAIHIEVHSYQGIIKMPLEACAFGSGMAYAMSAMALGQSAQQAIKFASRFDNNTNTFITSYYVAGIVDA